MATTAKLVTAEEFFLMPKGVNKRELVKGKIVEMAPVGGPHADVQAEMTVQMRLHARRTSQGVVVVELGFQLASDPDMVRAPDVAFISAEQLRKVPLVEGFYPGHPDVAVEVVSPGDTLTEIEEKVQLYLRSGTRLVWVVNPTTRVATVYYPDGRARVLRGEELLSGEDVMPGFEVRIGELFRD
jgi:Uma2 family endonuclease